MSVALSVIDHAGHQQGRRAKNMSHLGGIEWVSSEHFMLVYDLRMCFDAVVIPK